MGLAFAAGSLIFFMGVIQGQGGSGVNEGSPTTLPLLFAGIVSGAIASGLLLARTYRPDLGDRASSFGNRHRGSVEQSSGHRRSWWTGEPRGDA